MSVCQGCGTPLPPPNTYKPRKWCSERCRKRACYSGPCVDCGARTYSGDVVPSERCASCSSVRVAAMGRARHEAFREEVEAVWAEGLSIREMAVVFERTPGSMGTEICRMRAAGADLPYRYKFAPGSLERISRTAKATRARERSAA